MNGRACNGELSSASAILMSRILSDKEKYPKKHSQTQRQNPGKHIKNNCIIYRWFAVKMALLDIIPFNACKEAFQTS